MYLASYMMNKLVGFWPFLILRAWRNGPAFISIWNTWEKYLERNYDNIGLINLSTKRSLLLNQLKSKLHESAMDILHIWGVYSKD